MNSRHDHAEDDQQWLDLLAGRAVPGAPAPVVAEAMALRQGLRRYRLDAPPAALPATDERLQRLLERARQAGVLPAPADGSAQTPGETPATGPAAAPAAGTPRMRPGTAAPVRPRRWPAVALGLGLAAGVAAWWAARPVPSTAPPPFVLRGDGLLQRTVADGPAAQAERDALLQQLRQRGFEADAYEQLGRPGIDLVLVQPLTAAQQAALAELGITPGGGPQLRIEFVPRQP